MTTDSNSNSAIPKITRDDEEAGSGDLARENVERLKALFPQIVTGGKVDFDVLRQLLGDEVEEGEERYGLNWKGKRRARAFAMTPSLGTLRPAPEDSVNWGATQNIVIEGDNLEVLKLLRRSYAGSVKLIYIDPPYNTGGDFVYPDNYTDSIGGYLKLTGQTGEEAETLTSDREAAGRLHTDWLAMMYPRLMLAKELLRADGLIAIHIDEHEVGNLDAMLFDVFGESNHLGTIVWDKRNPKGEVAGVAQQHEYITIFCRNAAEFRKTSGLSAPKKNAVRMLDKARDFWHNSQEDAGEKFRAWLAEQPFSEGEKAYRFFDSDGELYQPVSMAAPDRPETRSHRPLLHPVSGEPCPVPAKGWRFPDRTMDKLLDDGQVVFGTDESVQPRRKYLLKENMTENRASLLYFGGSAHGDVEDMAGVFDNPKPIAVACEILQASTTNGDVILDFFAGSGTAGHAAIAQNAADGALRRFILVQLPEPLDPATRQQKAAAEFCDKVGKPRNIAELTKERLRRAGEKVREENPNANIDTGFRVYKLATSNLKPWQPDSENLEASILDAVDNVLPDRSEEDLLVELLLKTGIDLTMPEEAREIAGQTVHALGGGALMVCLGNIADEQAEELGQGMADWVDELDPAQTTVYFKDSGIGSDGNRAATKANLAAILRQRLGDRIAKIASI